MSLELERKHQQQFVQKVYSHGYRTINTRVSASDNHSLARGQISKVIIAENVSSNEFYTYSPMITKPTLYREFAAVNYKDEDAVIGFINTYGFLEEDDYYTHGLRMIDEPAQKAQLGNDNAQYSYIWYEPVIDVQRAIFDIRSLVIMMDAIQHKDRYVLAVITNGIECWLPNEYFEDNESPILIHLSEALIRSPLEVELQASADVVAQSGCPLPTMDELLRVAIQALSMDIQYNLSRAITTFVDVSKPFAPTLRMRPKNLLGAMYLQLAQDFTGERTYRKCETCDVWFEIGTGDNANKATRVYCSDACRLKAYRRRKKSQQH